MRRWLGLTAVVSMALGIAGACGGGEREPAEPAAEPPASPVAAPVAPEPAPAPAAPAVIEAPPRAEAPAAATPEPDRKAEAEKPTAAAEPSATTAKQPATAPSDPPAEPAAAAKPAIAGPCGDDDQPPCPLEGWMEKHLQQPFDDDQFARLRPEFEHLVKLVPDPSWNAGETGWATLAQAGAASAGSADRDGVQRACKGCHKAWRSKYKASFRKRAIE